MAGVAPGHLYYLGDYPGLDLRARRLYRWARQGSAALICFLMLGMNAKGDFYSRPFGVGGFSRVQWIAEYPAYISAKLGSSEGSIFEPISIRNSAPNIEKFLSLLNQKKVVIDDVGAGSANCLLRADQGDSCLSLEGKVEVWGQGRISEFKVDVDCGVPGCSVADVFDLGSNVIPIFTGAGRVSPPQPREANAPNYSALSYDQGTLRNFGGPLGGFSGFSSDHQGRLHIAGLFAGKADERIRSVPQTTGGPPESAGEQRNEPFGGVFGKSIVPLMLLLSAVSVWLASLYSARSGDLMFRGICAGWFVIIVWWGLL